MLHFCKDIHYLVMANIVMHNMMVEFYKAGDVDTDEKGYDVCND